MLIRIWLMRALIILAIFLLTSCSQPEVPIPTSTIPSTPALTATPAPTLPPTSTPTPLSTSTPKPTSTPTSTPVPLGVFALEWYPPLVMAYDPALWVDETRYASKDESERFHTNYLQAKGLESCRISVQGPTDFNAPASHATVQLGSVKYNVISFEDPAAGNTAFYIENQSLPDFSYKVGLPLPVIGSNASEWDQCQELGERVLSTLHMPPSDSTPLPYCTELATQYTPPAGYRLYCNPQFEHALLYPRDWETQTGESHPFDRANPLGILKGQDFFNYAVSNDIRVETWQNARILSDLVQSRKDTMQCDDQCMTYPIKLGGQTGYVLIVPSLQTYDVLFTFFERGDYFTQVVLMMNTKAGLEVYWQMVLSLQFPGTTPEENQIPAEVIDESYRHVGKSL